MFFDRYKTDIDRVYYSFYERNPMYCNPLDYCTTEEECAEYVSKIEIAQNKNKEWNEKRQIKWRNIFLMLALVGVVVVVVLFAIILFSDFLTSFWSTVFLTILIFSFGGLILLIINISDSSNVVPYKYKGCFFPVQNKCIEKLFDDYLWKEYLLGNEYKFSYSSAEKERLINNRTKEDRYRHLVALSHPYLELFNEIVAHELEIPSDVFAFGDVKFGMTAEEIYQTNCFKGLSYDSKKGINLGFKEDYLGRFWDFTIGTKVSFLFDNNHLSSVLIKTNSYNYKKNGNEMIEPFITCCKKLYQLYGSPVNLHRVIFSDHLELSPYDKAEFHIGYKRILLSVDCDKSSSNSYKYGIKLEFSRMLSVKESHIHEVVEFDDHWFDDMRRMYKRVPSVGLYNIDDLYDSSEL
jgi:F0F1-type ATP synthase assembly protein I